MQTLLTGFGPFGDVESNPAERLVRHFTDNPLSGHALTTCLLPVSYRRSAPCLLEAIDRGAADGQPFDLVWMLGVATKSAIWRVERFGRSANGTRADVDGCVPDECSDPGGAEVCEATIPVDAVVAALTASGIPAEPSDSAGGFLCNFGIYTALTHLKRSGSAARAGFLHIPPDTGTFRQPAAHSASIDFAQQVHAVEVALAALAIRSPN
ncbi:MAG TPA: pyroglutamyl-peptidase I [Chthonomonadaceae bacterium]|nr:pyroglutamyl-peptidase I [Chthonomonadaceae bacterium]